MAKHKRMLQAVQNADERFWEVRAFKNESGGQDGEILIYGPITNIKWFDEAVAPKALKEDIDALGDVDTLYVRVNSPGGSAWAGIAIYNILRRMDAEVVVTIDGLAASAASIIAMSGDKVRMSRGSMMMVHNAWTIAIGEAKDLRKEADVLDQLQKSMVSIYRDKTGLSDEKIVELLNDESWLTAEEALEFGFADEIDDAKEVAASLRDDKLVVNGREFDVSLFGVLPPFDGVAEKDDDDGGVQTSSPSESEKRPAVLKRAFATIANALGFGGGEQGGFVDVATVHATARADELASKVIDGLRQSDEDVTVPKSALETKGSDEPMGDVKDAGAQVVAPQVTEPGNDIENMDPDTIMARIAELEARAKAAEDLAKAERNLRIEAEFVKRVENYGTLPESAAVLGPIMKRASETMAKEDFEKLEAVLKAAGAALEQSDLFKSMGVSNEGDHSALGQYRAALKKVKENNPALTDAAASVEAFKSLPPDVQAKVQELGVL